MRASKRGGGDLTESSIGNKRTCCGAGETTKSLISGDLDEGSDQGFWSDLDEELALKLSKSVVSLALSDGHTVIFACSGVTIECNNHATRFMTSGSLVRALNNEVKDHDNLKIEVRHEGNVVTGFLEECDPDHEFSIVKITSFLDVHAVYLNHAPIFLPYCGVLSLGRDVSGKLMTTTGKLTFDSTRSGDSEYLMFSSCKLSELWEGGALFDFGGDFVGMNLVLSTKRSLFLPKSLIIERLEHFRTSQEFDVFLERVKDLKMARVRGKLRDDIVSHPEVHGDVLNKDLRGDLEAYGYPRPSKSGMILVNTFEDPFGDVYRRCAWSQLDKEVCKMIKRNVVSLASFRGDTMFFACSGFAIDWNDECGHNECQTILTSASLVRNSEYPFNDENKIADGLRIEVVLPNMQRTKGTLIHYNLHYNVALVSVRKLCSVYPAILKHEKVSKASKLVAVGRCFRSGDLMASSGKLVFCLDPFDCKKLPYRTTCEISKAGLGGPLVDVYGHYIGMNFHDPEKGSPFLFCDDIIDVLDYFKKRVKERLADDIPYSHAELHGGSSNKDQHGIPVASGCPIPMLSKIHGSSSNKNRHEILVASGYPILSKSSMNFAGTFGDPFGDLYYRCVWRQLSKGVYKMIRRNVVSLASFKGDTRFFACSGFVIDWDDGCGDNEHQTILTSACLVRNPEYPFDDGNKIVDGLRIEVVLRNKQRTEGTLIRYNLHYNVALVSVKEYCSGSPAVLLSKHETHGRVNHSSKVVAVGRCFKSGDLMASSGKLVSWSGPFDCAKLRYSTCKITKVGIGGPLVDLYGNYIGMNFYDPKVGTPVLSRGDIVKILDCFKKWSGAEADNFRIAGDDSVCLNMWPVPEPCWCYPGDSDGIDEYERKVLAGGHRFKYLLGQIWLCK